MGLFKKLKKKVAVVNKSIQEKKAKLDKWEDNRAKARLQATENKLKREEMIYKREKLMASKEARLAKIQKYTKQRKTERSPFSGIGSVFSQQPSSKRKPVASQPYQMYSSGGVGGYTSSKPKKQKPYQLYSQKW